jgi:hypothetical protein
MERRKQRTGANTEGLEYDFMYIICFRIVEIGVYSGASVIIIFLGNSANISFIDRKFSYE